MDLFCHPCDSSSSPLRIATIIATAWFVVIPTIIPPSLLHCLVPCRWSGVAAIFALPLLHCHHHCLMAFVVAIATTIALRIIAPAPLPLPLSVSSVMALPPSGPIACFIVISIINDSSLLYCLGSCRQSWHCHHHTYVRTYIG